MKTKINLIMAAIFAVLFFTLTVYAAEEEAIETPTTALEAAPTPEPEEESTEIIDIPELPKLPDIPPGIGTVIDFNTDPDGRLFYTIMTPDEHVFYLVIDKTGSADNVYFLNAVTVADLLPLVQSELPTTDGFVKPPPPISDNAEQNGEAQPLPEQEQPQGGGNTMYILIIAVVIVGGGLGYYFKIYRPKQQDAADLDEYDPSLTEAYEPENDYTAEWDEDGEAESGDEE
jgi:hypothetical protein